MSLLKVHGFYVLVADRIFDRIDGRCEGTPENGAVIPAYVLANGSSSSDVHEFVGRIDEHGGTLETANRLWTGGGCLSVSL